MAPRTHTHTQTHTHALNAAFLMFSTNSIYTDKTLTNRLPATYDPPFHCEMVAQSHILPLLLRPLKYR